MLRLGAKLRRATGIIIHRDDVEQEWDMTRTDNRVAFTVTWKVREGQTEEAAAIIARFAPEARKEMGLELLMVNQSAADPSVFLFYEVFTDAAAFAAHQETPHFRTMILEEALPLLSERARVEYVVV
jgi:quinol monooxygenase YgiN